MEQFVNVADKELVPLLREKFKMLMEAATWVDNQVLAHCQVPQTENLFHKEGGIRWTGSGGTLDSLLQMERKWAWDEGCEATFSKV